MINLPKVLTYLLIAFIIMKVAGIIDWSWWLVFSPVYVALLFPATLLMFVLAAWVSEKRMTPEQLKKHRAEQALKEMARRLIRNSN
jgi:undecaprenyl pyrophosphate phosphatase UppP